MAVIPHANPAPGPADVAIAPRASPADANRTAGILAAGAGVGSDAAAVLGKQQLEGERTIDLIDATTRATKALNDLDLKVGKDPDHRTAKERFTKGAVAIREDIMRGLDNATALRFAGRFDPLVQGRIGQVENEAWRKEAQVGRVKLDGATNEAVTAALLAKDAVERKRLLQTAKDNIDAAAAAGYLFPADALKRKEGVDRTFQDATAIRLIEANPWAAVKALNDKDQFKALPAGRREILIGAAQRRIKAMVATAKATVTADVKSIETGFVEKGKSVPDAVLEDLTRKTAATGDKKLIARVARIRDDNQFAIEFNAKTLKEQQDAVNSLPGAYSTAKSPAELEALNRRGEIMRRMLAENERQAKDNPNALAASRGVTLDTKIDPAAPVTMEDGQGGVRTYTWRQQVEVRTETSVAGSRTLGVPTRFLDANEKDFVASYYAKQDIDGKLTFLGDIAAGARGRAAAWFRELDEKDPTLASSGMLVAEGKVGVARKVLLGSAWLRENKGGLKALKDLKAETLKQLRPLSPAVGTRDGGAVRDVDAGAANNRAAAAIVAIYTADTVAAGETDEETVDTARLANAFKQFLGGTGFVNGQMIQTPREGVTGEQMQYRWRRASLAQIKAATGTLPVASTGRAGTVVPVEQVRDAVLVSYQKGRYIVMNKTPDGRLLPFRRQDNGELFILDWSKFEGARVDGRVGVDTGFKTTAGRPIYSTPDGELVSEKSITVRDPRLNGGRWTNIPSIWGDRQYDEDGAIGQALKSGQRFEAFDTMKAAVAAAKRRSGGLIPPALEDKIKKRGATKELPDYLGVRK